MKNIVTPFIFFVVFLVFCVFLRASVGNEFVFTQLKHDGIWDPYPGISSRIMGMVKKMTNIPFSVDRKVVTLSDPDLFESSFLVVSGSGALAFNPEEKKNLKLFIDRGGLVFFDDTLAEPKGAFSRSVRSILKDLYPDRSFVSLSSDHPLFRSFFLLKNGAGRKMSQKYLEGIEVESGLGGESRTAVVYSGNDLLGSWMRDNLGQYTYECVPGGEFQRWESLKLTINLIYFSLTGTYKRDAIHQPFIERKLGT
ncbi:MAG: DUF4159 domain-containing protein [Elusimicrobiota bacterium]